MRTLRVHGYPNARLSSSRLFVQSSTYSSVWCVVNNVIKHCSTSNASLIRLQITYMHTNDVSSGEEPNTNKPGQVRGLHREGNGSCTSRQILKGNREWNDRGVWLSVARCSHSILRCAGALAKVISMFFYSWISFHVAHIIQIE